MLLCASSLTACSLVGARDDFPYAVCERVNISSNGNAVTGIEDMAYDAPTQALYLSAYDRRTQSLGGIYRLDIDALSTDSELTVAPVIDGIRPHGLDLSRANKPLNQKNDTVFLSFIDRQGNENAQKPAIRTLSWHDDNPQDLTQHETIAGPDICAANNLTHVQTSDNPVAIYITQDHKNCTRKAQNRENILSPNQGSVSGINTSNRIFTSLLTDLSFANGISISADHQQLYIAETRKKRLTVYTIETGNRASMQLSGGPDNLTRDGTDIYAAIIPNLLQFLRFKSDKDKTSPSRFAIISLKPNAPQSDISSYDIQHYDVPASIISGATVAIKAGEHIWLGAAYDNAIARCSLAEASL